MLLSALLAAPRGEEPGGPPHEDAGSSRPVRFPTADGLILEGRVFPAGPTWVVLAHMRPADMTSFYDFAEELVAAGYTAFAYNNRGYGNSEPGPGGVVDVAADARAALAFAGSRGAARLFFVGASMNAPAALVMGAEEDLAGIVTLSGVPDWEGTSGLARAGEITAPALFVAARDDKDRVEIARSFGAATGGPHAIVEYETGGHGTDLFVNDDLAPRIVEFLDRSSSGTEGNRPPGSALGRRP
jgi:pimeloyl-ACP methyl ester carboxylesterase